MSNEPESPKYDPIEYQRWAIAARQLGEDDSVDAYLRTLQKLAAVVGTTDASQPNLKQ